MNYLRNRLVTGLACALGGALLVAPARSADKSGAADEAAKIAELGRPNANHKLLAQLVGTWNCKVSFSLGPNQPPGTSTGTAVRTSVMDGRYFVMNTTAKMQMPGPDGKMQTTDYKAMEIDGFDNMKGTFFSTFLDNMGTGLLIAEGTYDPASKTFTYHLQENMAPGSTTQVRETVQIVDQDHYVLQWYENQGGKEAKTMEITYTRQK